MATSESHLLPTLGVALLFAAIFLFGGRAPSAAGRDSHRRFLSFAAGVSVAYTFVHVLPSLNTIRELQARSPSHSMVFPEHGVYLWTMVGFLAFFGLATMASGSQTSGAHGAHRTSAPVQWPWLQMGGFAVYTSLLAYMMVWSGKNGWTLGLFAVAMGLHLFMISSNLGSHCREAYHPRGARLLAAASLVGWAAAATVELPVVWLLNLVAFVIAGVVVNAAITELPQENRGSYVSFLIGTVSYTALLLTLSHLESAA